MLINNSFLILKYLKTELLIKWCSVEGCGLCGAHEGD
jgi:hypothetical protein